MHPGIANYKIFLCMAFLGLISIIPFLLAAQELKRPIFLADPTIFYHNGVYHLYGTGEDSTTNRGFLVYTSPDLENWKGPVGASEGYALKMGDAFGKKGFWAPQVLAYNGKFYMAYTADEQLAIAVGESPLGPFRQEQKKPLLYQKRNIDPFILIDDDRRVYLYHVKVANGGNRIFAAEMKKDLSAVIPETTIECIQADEPWENMEKAQWTVTEGPTVVKRNGLYYMIYSANDFRSPYYAVGYAVSKSPVGPWKKPDKNPVLDRLSIGRNGSGHGDVFADQNANLCYVFHTHNSADKVGPRRTALARAEFNSTSGQQFKIEANSFRYLYTKEASKRQK